MQTIEEVTRKINKLLKLANGGTEAEAKSAMDKALQLASENSLDLATAAILGEEKIESTNEPVEEEGVTEGTKLRITDPFIISVLQNHFNVKILFRYRGSRQTEIYFVGTKSDIRIAKEIYERLTEIFQYTWVSYRARTNSAVEMKRVYFGGLMAGINSVLSESRRQMIERYVGMLPEAIDKTSAANQYQLILSTPKERNEEYIKMRYSKLKSHSRASYGYNHNVYSDGVTDGRSIDVEGKRKVLTA